MKYLGSKRRIAKFILPIMMDCAIKNKISTWVEPFVGGGNMIERVPPAFDRIGIDYNEHTINALIAIRDLVNELPTEVSVEYYNYIRGSDPDPVTSLIRFGASFAGKFENGYARRNGKSMWMECVRNARKQSPKLRGMELIHSSYDQVSGFKNCLIYCDPPYKGTTSYSTGSFDHDKFWDWCRDMSSQNQVFVSEYGAPDDFGIVWEMEVNVNISSQRTSASPRVERLFKYEP